jgi:hypothetical protein
MHITAAMVLLEVLGRIGEEIERVWNRNENACHSTGILDCVERPGSNRTHPNEITWLRLSSL